MVEGDAEEGPRVDGARMECVYFKGQIVKIVRKKKGNEKVG